MVRAPLLLVGLLAGCAEVPCEDMTRSEQGLVVTEAEHGIGWGEPSCYSCHLQAALHTRGCTPGVDLEAIREQVAAQAGTRGCAECHGPNGGSGTVEGAE